MENYWESWNDESGTFCSKQEPLWSQTNFKKLWKLDSKEASEGEGLCLSFWEENWGDNAEGFF